MAATQPSAEQLVRAIRREEAHIAQMRALSAARRAALLEKLTQTAGSASGAARLLGVSPQAVSKSLNAAIDEAFSAPRRIDAAINALDVRLGHGPGWGSDIVTEAEWQAMDDEDAKRAAAREAARAWELRRTYTQELARFLRGIATGCVALDEAAPEDVATVTQRREIMEDAGLEAPVPEEFLPRSQGEARALGRFFAGLAFGIGSSTGAETYQLWRERAEA